jgi:D-glycero-alpha-D-manno-heptose-7-phosphate kinase
VLERTLVIIPKTETIEEAFRRLNANMLGILFAA